MKDPHKPERRGGKRKGAGRKPNFVKKMGLTPTSAGQLLALVDEQKLALSLLNDRSPDVRLRAWAFLREHAYGKPRQAFFGAVGVANVNPEMAPFSDADLESQIQGLMEQLGVSKPPLLPAPELPPAAAPQPQTVILPDVDDQPQPYQQPEANFCVPEAEPMQVIRNEGQNNCDRHGPFPAKSTFDQCPQCKEQWQQDAAADERRLSGLLPAEPSWSRR